METLERALELLLARARAVRETELVPLGEALGRVTAEDIASPMAVPPFDRSPLDGYCLRSEDIAGAFREHPAVLEVVGEACAGCGERFFVRPGQALRVMTGAPIADGCDCVVRQEDTDEGMSRVCVYASVAHHQNICWAGEDVRPGAVVVHAGERLTPAHLACSPAWAWHRCAWCAVCASACCAQETSSCSPGSRSPLAGSMTPTRPCSRRGWRSWASIRMC